MSEHDLQSQFDDQQFDDQPLEAWLVKADPVVDGELDDSATRLRNLWEQMVTAQSQPVSVLRVAIRRSSLRWVASLAMVASLLAICSAGLWWVTNRTSAPLLVDGGTNSSGTIENTLHVEAERAAVTIEDRSIPESDVGDKRAEQMDIGAGERSAGAVVKRPERQVVKIVTVQHLWQELSQRKPKQRFPLLQLDEEALKGELGQWLEDWSGASPEQREQFAAQWNQNRVYWLPWAKRWCGSWKDSRLNSTALEVIAADEKDVCVPFLFAHLDNERLRKTAWTHACRLGSIEQLVQLAPRAVNCEEVQVLASALIVEASPQATGMLCQLVADPRCRSAIAKIEIDWPDQHVSNGWAELTGGTEGEQATAATLLATIPSSQVDRLLVEQLNSGQHQVAALSVLMLRDTQEARRFLTQSQSSRRVQKQSLGGRAVVANLLSARQQLVRWSFQTASIPFLSPKVCESCSVSS